MIERAAASDATGAPETYLDKKITNPVEIVQTLSRLNRATSGKTRLTGSTSSTNQVVLEGFAKYEAGDCIQDVQNAKVMYDLQAELDRAGIYTDQEIKAYTAVRFKSGAAYAVGEKAQYKDLYAATSILTLRFNDRPAALRKAVQDSEAALEAAKIRGNEAGMKAADATRIAHAEALQNCWTSSQA